MFGSFAGEVSISEANCTEYIWQPGTMTPAQLSRAFINNPFQGARFTNFVEIDTSGLNVIQGRPGVYVFPNEAPLDLTGRVTNSGKVLGK
jgi:hypothetical protein